MKLIKLSTFVLLSVILSGCWTVSKKMESWVGSHKSQLYQSWGPPHRVTEDGQGGEILIYEAYVNTGQTPGYIAPNSYGGYRYTAPRQNGYNKSRMFYVNNRGIVYSWRWRGL